MAAAKPLPFTRPFSFSFSTAVSFSVRTKSYAAWSRSKLAVSCSSVSPPALPISSDWLSSVSSPLVAGAASRTPRPHPWFAKRSEEQSSRLRCGRSARSWRDQSLPRFQVGHGRLRIGRRSRVVALSAEPVDLPIPRLSYRSTAFPSSLGVRQHKKWPRVGPEPHHGRAARTHNSSAGGKGPAPLGSRERAASETPAVALENEISSS